MKNPSLLILSLCFLFVACSKEETTAPPPPTNGTSRAVVLIQDEIEGEQVILAGSQSDGYMVAYNRTLSSGELLTFEALPGVLPKIMKDQEGNEWDIFGRAVSGPREGTQLESVSSYIGFWFSFGTMFPGVELYDGPAYTGNFQQAPPREEWAIPTVTIAAGTGFNSIPSIDAPNFDTFIQRDLLAQDFPIEDDDLVVGIQIDGILRLYPHYILNWHEIVNDKIGDTYFSVSFCPLTGTALAWDRELSNGVTTFGVSGLLYNSNVVPYDRSTESYWSQMREDCINGDMLGDKLKGYPVVETKWSTWKKIISTPTVLNTDTGIGKDYDVNPYESYISNNDLISFPVEYDDTRLPRKDRVLGVVIDGKAKVYQFKDF